MARTPRAPWKRPSPRKRAGKAAGHLSPAEKSAVRARAKRAGRRYPNLVDNMRAASAPKTPAKKTAAKPRVGRKRAATKSAVKKAAGRSH